MHTLGYAASALFFLVEIGLFLGFLANLMISHRRKRIDDAKLWKLHQGTILAMVMALVYPALAAIFAASLGIFDTFGVMFLILVICPVAVERGLIVEYRDRPRFNSHTDGWRDG